MVVISDRLWQRKFGAREDVLGRTVQLDKQPFVVVGVLPARFELFQPADLYMPIGPWAATLPDDRGWHPGILPVARLREGVSLERARAEMDIISRQLEAEYPQFNREVRAVVRPLHDVLVQNVRPALLVLLGAVTLVLLIACGNVANLLLARGVGRQKEIAVRSAIGGSRARIVRQLVIESLLLSCAGGAAGLIVASWSVSALMALVTGLPRAGQIEVNLPVLIFALSISVLTGLVFGLVPALQATRFDLRDALNEEGRGSSTGARHHRMRNSLVVAEVALALVLLIGAGLMLRSFAALQNKAPGFDVAHLLVVDMPLSPTTYRDDLPRTTAVERVLERVKMLPGVAGAAATTGLPMSGGGADDHVQHRWKAAEGPGRVPACGLPGGDAGVPRRHEDSAAARPRDRGARSPGGAARRRHQRVHGARALF